METYRLHRGRLIDHIQLVVNDFEASKAFYTAVLAVRDPCREYLRRLFLG
jgi:catechol 2,3-dioxygenase-like lactoylglutathione lyase family enzyme